MAAPVHPERLRPTPDGATAKARTSFHLQFVREQRLHILFTASDERWGGPPLTRRPIRDALGVTHWKDKA